MGIYGDEKERNEKEAWLKGLKAGDRVAVYSGGWARDLPEFKKVIRTTDKQIVLAGYSGIERKYWRKDGYKVGGSGGGYYGREYLAKPTPEMEAQIRLASARSTLKHAKWDDFDERLVLELARRVEAEQALLKAEAEEGKAGDTGE